MTDPPTKLVLSGGGPNGLLHLGSLLTLRSLGLLVNIQAIAGTSIGAVIGFALAFQYPLEQILADLEVFLPSLLSPNFDLMNLYVGRALRSMDPVRHFLHRVLRAKGLALSLTFKDMAGLAHIPWFVTCATALRDTRLQVFSAWETPEVPVVRAVLASAAVPLIFAPVRVQGSLYVDGGLILNTPTHLIPQIPGRELVLWIRDVPVPTSPKPRPDPHMGPKTVAIQSVKAMYMAQNNILETWFNASANPDFVTLPAFSNGFLPVPIAEVGPPIHTGIHHTCLHILCQPGSGRRTRRCALHYFIWNVLLWRGFWVYFNFGLAVVEVLKSLGLSC